MSETTRLKLRVNGEELSAEVEPQLSLAQFLRDELRLTGTKVGCTPGKEDCGACMVLVDGQAVKACCTRVADVAGKAITTIEGLAQQGVLDPVQEAFIRTGAIQCGFCTPGYVIATKELLAKNPNPSVEEIKAGLSGLLCRCTGYTKIIEAVQVAATFLREGRWPEVPVPASTNGPISIGVPVWRKEAVPKATGTARFAADYYRENMLHAALRFSDRAYAELVSIGTAEAEQMPGVVAVLTHKDVPGLNRSGPKYKDRPMLAEGKVRTFVEVVAVAIAETEAQARAAAAKVQVEYRDLPAVFDAEEALQPGAPVIHEGWPNGNLLATAHVERGDVEQGFAQADVVVEDSYSIPMVDHAFIEPEAALAYVDERGILTVVIPSQCPYRDRNLLAEVLGVQPERVRIISPWIGGAFGGKEDLTLHPFVALGAMKTGRPVKLVTNRAESFYIHHKKHGFKLYYRTGCTRDGLITAVQGRFVANGGAYAHAGPMIIMQATIFGAGPYYVPNIRLDGYRAYTNDPPCGAFRGFGINQVTFAMENQVDQMARAIGMDPIEFRLKNALEVGKPTATGQMLKASVGLKECLRHVQRELASLEVPKSGNGKRYGVGVAAGYKNCGIGQGRPDLAGAIVELTPEGSVRLRVGATDVGEGCTTIMAQICAQTLGIPYEAIEILTPDTELTPDCGQTSASRQTLMTGNATLRAAASFREKLLSFVGDTHEIAPADLIWNDGRTIWSKDGKYITSLDKVARLAAERGVELQGDSQFSAPQTFPLGDQSCENPEDYRNYFTFSFVAQGILVEVDEQTGKTRVLKAIAGADCGRIIHPQGLTGQIEGSISMGLGYALSEEFASDQGKPTTLSLTDVGVMPIGETPEIVERIVEDPEPDGPFGAKGFAEAALLPTAPAIINAIYDATGVRVKDLPARPEKLKARLEQAVK